MSARPAALLSKSQQVAQELLERIAASAMEPGRKPSPSENDTS